MPGGGGAARAGREGTKSQLEGLLRIAGTENLKNLHSCYVYTHYRYSQFSRSYMLMLLWKYSGNVWASQIISIVLHCTSTVHCSIVSC